MKTNQLLSNQLFKSVEKLLYSQSWRVAKRYKMDFEDVRSQAFEIFCEAVHRFDEIRGNKFITFLCHRLRTLNDYCTREYNYKTRIMDKENVLENLKASSPADRILFRTLVNKLSDDSQSVLVGLMYGAFNDPEQERIRDIGKGRIHQVCNSEWGWSGSRTEAVWNELSKWWGENEVLVACN